MVYSKKTRVCFLVLHNILSILPSFQRERLKNFILFQLGSIIRDLPQNAELFRFLRLRIECLSLYSHILHKHHSCACARACVCALVCMCLVWYLCLCLCWFCTQYSEYQQVHSAAQRTWCLFYAVYWLRTASSAFSSPENAIDWLRLYNGS